MLATLAALQLLVIAQAAAPALPNRVRPAVEVSAPAPSDAPTSPDAAAPLPPPEAPAPTPPAATPPPATPPAASPSPAEPRRQRLPSLLGAEPLGGTSAAFAWAGWSSLGVAYAIGISAEDDLGGFYDLDWAKSESRLGLVYRRPFAQLGTWDVAVRIAASWYVDFGATYVYSGNHSDHGFEVAPALVVSTRAGSGLLAASAEGPMTVTTKHRNGFLFSPRAAVSYEAPLYSQVTVGALFGAGYRAGAGGAPLSEGRGELRFLVLLGYQLL